MSKEAAFSPVIYLNDNAVISTADKIDLQNPNKEWRSYRIVNQQAHVVRLKFVNDGDADVEIDTGMEFAANAIETFSSQKTHLSVIAVASHSSLNITSGTGA